MLVGKKNIKNKNPKRGLIRHFQLMILLAFDVQRYITTTTPSVAVEGVRLSVSDGR